MRGKPEAYHPLNILLGKLLSPLESYGRSPEAERLREQIDKLAGQT
jgi:hypothetical protein